MTAVGSTLPQKYKVVLLGDQSVGKTSLIVRYLKNMFEEKVDATIGMDFQSKTVNLPDRTIRLQLWDTAGQERFRSLIPSYIRDTASAVLVYDITKRKSFDGIRRWLDDVRNERGTECVIMVVGNKTDLSSARQVTTEEGSKLARELGTLFIETSAKEGSNIVHLFQQVAAALPLPADSAVPVPPEHVDPPRIRLGAAAPTPVEKSKTCQSQC